MPPKPREIWEKGTSLSEAWYDWSNDVLRKRFDKLGGSPDLEPNEGQGLLDAMAGIASALQKVLDQPRQKTKITEEMKTDLLEWLSEEELLAYGFPIRPSPARTPRRIDAAFWINPNVDWDRSTANDAVYAYQRIRIVDPKDFPKIDLKPKIGRKSNGDLIKKHAYLLFKRYPEAVDLTNKDKVLAVRKSIKKENSDIDAYGKGFGDDTIRKHVKTIEVEFEKVLDSL